MDHRWGKAACNIPRERIDRLIRAHLQLRNRYAEFGLDRGSEFSPSCAVQSDLAKRHGALGLEGIENGLMAQKSGQTLQRFDNDFPNALKNKRRMIRDGSLSKSQVAAARRRPRAQTRCIRCDWRPDNRSVADPINGNWALIWQAASNGINPVFQCVPSSPLRNISIPTYP